MKTFKVIYERGHFIDKETRKRILPVQGEEYMLFSETGAFLEEDEMLKLPTTKDAEEKRMWAIGEFGEGNFVRVLEAGQQLVFRLGNSKSANKDLGKEYLLTCKLMEDLYLYRLKKRSGEADIDWRAANCLCVLEDCLRGDLTLTDKITAISLNQLFSNVVQFYFSLQRSSAVSIFNDFYLYEPGMNVSFGGALRGAYESLGDIRKRYFAPHAKDDQTSASNLFG
jgi:hypothetical protein